MRPSPLGAPLPPPRSPSLPRPNLLPKPKREARFRWPLPALAASVNRFKELDEEMDNLRLERVIRLLESLVK